MAKAEELGSDSEFIDIVGYESYEARTPDTQYRELLQRILDEGKKIGTPLEDEALTLFAPGQLRYDLRNGFPLLTERSLADAFKPAIAELTAFINGVHTLQDLEAWGCKWWGNFVTPEKTSKRGLAPGELGSGSYGPAYHDFPTPTGVQFNQIKAVVDQINARPELRTHVATTIVPWAIFRAPGYKQETVWVPCHGSFLHFRVMGEEISLHHVQRSADTPVGLVYNIAQYSALLLTVAKVTGYRPHEYIHTLSDAHIYERQLPDVEDLLTREPRRFPTALIRATLTDVFDWRKGDIQIQDYHPHDKKMIDTPTG